MIYTREELINEYQKNKRIKYIFFWVLNKKPKIKIDESCLSQWYLSGFTKDNIYYRSAEYYMMAEKARLFDEKMVTKILEAKTSKEVKQLGREIENFDEKEWEERSFDIVVEGNLRKFSENKKLKDFLLGTSQKVLVEASPYDKNWGIGLDSEHIYAKNPLLWKGKNKLGFALMKVRDILRSNNLKGIK